MIQSLSQTYSTNQLDLTRYIGLPYLSRGRSEEGIDCYGIIIKFYKECLGIDLPDYVNEHSSSDDSVLVTVTRRSADLSAWIPQEKPQFGDVIVFIVMGHPLHVGMYLADGDFLHCLQGRNSCIENLDKWGKRVQKFIRYRGIIDEQ